MLAWLALEALSITSAFHLGILTGVRLTPESTNFSLIMPLVWGKRVLFVAGIALLVAGAYSYRYAPPLGTISILIDGSKSMLVQDVEKSRFDLARDHARRIIEKYPGSPVRISVFGGDLLTLVPATYDPEILKRALDSISLKHLSGGSDIIGALRAHLASIGDEPGTIYVISDGEVIGNRTGMKDTYIKTPSNVSISTIGVGTAAGGNIPMGVDLFGKPVFKMIDGVPITSRLEEELLQKITAHGGQYQNPSNADELEFVSGSAQHTWMTPYVPRMFDISALLLVLALLLPYRKRITR